MDKRAQEKNKRRIIGKLWIRWKVQFQEVMQEIRTADWWNGQPRKKRQEIMKIQLNLRVAPIKPKYQIFLQTYICL